MAERIGIYGSESLQYIPSTAGGSRMSFIFYPSPTPVFPALAPLAWPIHKKAIMASRSTIATTGREVRVACCAYPRWSFTLTYGGNSWLRDQTQNIRPDATLAGLTELQQLSGLFLQCKGTYGEFYYSDPDDNSRLAAPVGVGDGTTTIFPLFYPWGNGPFAAQMLIPVGGIQSLDAVYRRGYKQDPASYSLDSTNTKIVFSTTSPYYAPYDGDAITADFHFYFRCRFLHDTMHYSQFSRNLWEVKSVQFESVKQ